MCMNSSKAICEVTELFRDGDIFDDDRGATYSVIRSLSDGGMGATYVVEDLATKLQYVAKTP